MRLRPYQQTLVDEVSAAFKSDAASVVMQLGTGGGKTKTAAHLLERAIIRGYRCVFLAHLDTLVEDTHERLVAAGVRAGFVQAGRPSDPEAPVQVCSIATLHARGERPPADFVIIDECHRALSASVRGILASYPNAALLGLTATPQRGDARPLGDVFERLIMGPSNRWLTDNGFLVPCDLLENGEEAKGLTADPVAMYARHAPGKRAIVFAANKAHAAALVAQFNAAGFAADMLVGETSRTHRRELRAKLRTGELLILVGVGVFLEGFDAPEIEVVILARAFGVCMAFLQAIGRGLRPSPSTGKTRCTVLDLRGAVYAHGLPDEDRLWSLTGKAVRRAETLTALMRCRDCLAIFRPSSKCPRCGASCVSAPKIPRVLSRPERLEQFSALPPNVRDFRYLTSLEGRARSRMNMSERVAAEWALRKFKQRFGREPYSGGEAA